MASSSSMLKNFFKPNLEFNNNIGGGSIGTSQSNSNGEGLLLSNNNKGS